LHVHYLVQMMQLYHLRYMSHHKMLVHISLGNYTEMKL
jgi:hypothetical protein